MCSATEGMCQQICEFLHSTAVNIAVDTPHTAGAACRSYSLHQLGTESCHHLRRHMAPTLSHNSSIHCHNEIQNRDAMCKQATNDADLHRIVRCTSATMLHDTNTRLMYAFLSMSNQWLSAAQQLTCCKYHAHLPT